MSNRLVALAIPFTFAACLQRGEQAEPISVAESAAITAATESAIVAFAPISSANATAIAEAYAAAYPQDGAVDGRSCATIETDNLTFVKVTFACTGLFATTGTLSLTISGGDTVETMSDLTIGNVEIDGVHTLTVPADPTAERTFDGQLSIMGPRRELDSESQASWVVSGNCVTYSASGSVSFNGPNASATKSFEVTDRTACR